jgi:hypothetical protein
LLRASMEVIFRQRNFRMLNGRIVKIDYGGHAVRGSSEMN